MSDFQSETAVGKLRTSPSTLCYHIQACQSAGALIRDNTVILIVGQRECDRKCPICKTAVESEIHIMFECPGYNNTRNEFLSNNIGVDPHIDSVDKLRY